MRSWVVVAILVLIVIAVAGSEDSHNSAGVSSYADKAEHPACAVFRVGVDNVEDEEEWGPFDQCDTGMPHDWLRRARSNCYSCLSGANVCTDPPTILYHQYLDHLHPDMWEGNLLSLKAFLMTQNLARAHLYLWVADAAKVVVPNKTEEFFREFSDYITVREFHYDEAIRGTPWEGDKFFGNGTLVQSMMPEAGSYTDLVRILVLNNHGGLWMDNDVVFYQDLTHLLSTSYQFVMRCMNLHIMRMEKGSRLMQRALQLATTMPLNHPDFKATIINKLCRPNGYSPLVMERYGYTDIYNGCLFRLLLRFKNTGPPDAVLYDMPLAWWDHDWKGCFDSRLSISDAKWREVATHYLAMHNRYPRQPHRGPASSPLNRVMRTVDAFWAACGRKDCTPVDGMPLIAYDGFASGPPSYEEVVLNWLQLQQKKLHQQVHTQATDLSVE